ncbi:unnamed protein product [Darwinula stevensoni]|uniref:Inositol-1-monophosphatase n=1 Tax=Darwinula stevensoni TaxID=69355 RepID=A0A7R9AG81_9CRUS|nr:unnamed protein product [Darwinula stevensoni]CAG0903746.1 unnamed protein product [Darwinula stevensoni]
MDHLDLDLAETTLMELADEAGRIIREAFSKEKRIKTKSSNVDLVTETDQKVEMVLKARLAELFPTHKFIGEESTAGGAKCQLTDEPTWIIDPVDGTMNFVHGFPFIAVSIALVVQRQPVLGIVYNPILELKYSARIGKGSFLNGEKLQVSGQEDLSQALIFIEIGTGRDPEKMKCVQANFANLISQVHGVRLLGSAALQVCMVAQGACDAYSSFGVHVWDIAAGALIVTEAGGIVCDTAGAPLDLMGRRILVTSSLKLTETLSNTLVQYSPDRDDV